MENFKDAQIICSGFQNPGDFRTLTEKGEVPGQKMA